MIPSLEPELQSPKVFRMSTMTDFDLVSKSFNRCKDNPRFMPRFYEIFMKSSPRIAPYFSKTDMAKQHGLLKEGLELLIMFGFGSLKAKAYMSKMGELHDRKHINVPPELYPLWVNSMVATVRDTDPEFTPEIEESWRRHLQKGIDRITSTY